MTQPPKTIHVEWAIPVAFEAAKDLNGDDDYGLYQIFGHHPVYSEHESAVLLYVGSAVRQTFGRRLSQHATYWIAHEPRLDLVQVSFGRLKLGTYDDDPPAWVDWTQQVIDAEKLTIWWNTPAYNSRNIARPPVLECNSSSVQVVNEGDFGRLMQAYGWPVPQPPILRGDDS